MIKGLTKLERLGEKVYHLHFQSDRLLNKTFLRFQEYYESPEFKGKIFTLDEFKTWYKSFRKSKHFSYYTDFSGCNIPSKILKPFFDGHFTDLSGDEKALLSLFKNVKGKYYIIGSCVDTRHELELTINHELVHALFYLNTEYRKKVIKCVEKFDTKLNSTKQLLIEMGYSESVMVDEINAYFATDPGDFAERGISMLPLKKLTDRLKNLYNEYRTEILYS